MAEPENPSRAGRVAFTHPDFSLYQLARFFIVASLEMQSVAVGWQVYEITKRPLDLGLVGLAQFLPGILLFLVSGHAADRLDRRKLLINCYGGFAGVLRPVVNRSLARDADGLSNLHRTGSDWHRSIPQWSCEPGIAAADRSRGAFPQCGGMEQHRVSGCDNPRALPWWLHIRAHQGSSAVFTISILSALGAIFCTLQIKSQTKARAPQQFSMKTVLAGLSYIRKQKVVLGSISLDLFAVLLGGAVALLPVYARGKSCGRVHGGLGFCAALRVSAPERWRFSSRTGRCATVLA